MFQIHYFSSENGETEFVIISDRAAAEVAAEFGDADVSLVQSLGITDDASTLPCDRMLVKE